MENNTTATVNRTSELIKEISCQLKALSTAADASDVDAIVAQNEKSGLILKQSQIISDLIARDITDDRDKQIAELNAELDKAEENTKLYRGWYHHEQDRNKLLKEALRTLVQLIDD